MKPIALLAVLLAVGYARDPRHPQREIMAKMRSYRDQMCACKTKPCADKVMQDITVWSTDVAKEGTDRVPKPRYEEMQEMTKVAEKLDACMEKAMAAAELPAEAPDPAAGAGLPEQCDDYKAAIDAFVQCEKVPKATRDAMKRAYDATYAGWASIRAADRPGLAPACKAGADAARYAGAVCDIK